LSGRSNFVSIASRIGLRLQPISRWTGEKTDGHKWQERGDAPTHSWKTENRESDRMVKIAIVASGMQAGGAERQLALWANGWVKAGEEVDLVLLNGPQDPIYFPLHQVVRVLHLDSQRDTNGLIEAVGNGIWRAQRLHRLLLEEGADIVLAVLPEAMIYAAIAARRLGVPLLLSQVNNPADDPLPLRWRAMRRIAFNSSAAIVFQTDRARNAAKAAFRDKGLVIPNIVQPPGEIGVDHGATEIVAAGRLSSEKGFDILLRAMKRVRLRHPQWHLTIFGEGPERPALEGLAAELGLDEAAVSLPGVSDTPLGWARGAGLYVLPSRTEGFPNVLCEAMAHGYPVVAADCRFGPAEIITDGENGLLVPKEDPAAMADAICRLIENPELRRAIGDRAKAVTEMYSENRVIQLWLDLIRRF
jgi:glycosyltransferase involved in cell wall biosynthesis